MITLDALNALPMIRHGFATRPMGVSTGLYRGLNCGLGSRDTPEHIHQNRHLAASALGFDGHKLVTLYQIHSPDIVTVTEAWPHDQAPKADGMVTRTPGIVLGVLAADCAPLIFVDPDAGIIGACHAGWRGAIGGVAEATTKAMCALGATQNNIIAAIGPCIGPNSYEVSLDFRDPFMDQDAENQQFFRQGQPGKFLFDLPGYLTHRLRKVGINNILQSGLDTLPNEEQFFSYRRTTLRGEPDYGRNISMIALVP